MRIWGTLLILLLIAGCTGETTFTPATTSPPVQTIVTTTAPTTTQAPTTPTPTTEPPTTTPIPAKTIKVEKGLNRLTYASGNGYAGTEDVITIHDTGLVIQSLVPGGEKVGILPNETTSDLFKLSNSDITRLEDKYECTEWCPFDLNFNYIEVYKDDKQVKEISWYPPDEPLPKKLTELLEAIILSKEKVMWSNSTFTAQPLS